MSKKTFGLALSALLCALCSSAAAQHPKIPRIGYISPGGDPDAPGFQVEAFRRGLQDLGYVEGKNILIEYRYAEGKPDRRLSLVRELVQLKVDVLVLTSLDSIREAKQVTKLIPIVMVATVDPVSAGLVDSLARPRGNITGLTRLMRDLSGKRLELLKEVVPHGISRVGVLWDVDTRAARIAFKEYEAAAQPLKIELQSLEVRGPKPDLDGAFRAAGKGRESALVTISSGMLARNRKQIADLAVKSRLPSMHEQMDYVEAGGLMSYSADDAKIYKRAAYYVDRILKGTKPTDLPVEQPTKFEFIINLKTAKQIGVTIPPNVLARADRVIK
jgi:ABC-type uncharacterized transport system substrate-binding protein